VNHFPGRGRRGRTPPPTTLNRRRIAPPVRAHAPCADAGAVSGRERIVGMREGRQLLSGLLIRLACGAPPYTPTLRRQRNRRTRECVTAARSTNSRSFRSSRRRASRERWSSSTLGTLRLHGLVLGMVPPLLTPPATVDGSTEPVRRRSPSALVCHRVITAYTRPSLILLTSFPG